MSRKDGIGGGLLQVVKRAWLYLSKSLSKAISLTLSKNGPRKQNL